LPTRGATEADAAALAASRLASAAGLSFRPKIGLSQPIRRTIAYPSAQLAAVASTMTAASTGADKRAFRSANAVATIAV
jgi:hypothetical protein